MKATIKNIGTEELLIEEIQFEGSIDELKDFFTEMGIVMPKIYRKEDTDNSAPSKDEWDDCKKESNAVEPPKERADDCPQKLADKADDLPVALYSLQKLAGWYDKIVDLPHISAIVRDVDGTATKVDVTWGDTKRIGATVAMEKLWDSLRQSVMSGTTKSIDKAFVATRNTLYVKMARACNVKHVANDACNKVEAFFNQKHVDCITFISDGEIPTRL